jgi:uracil DNA glycosylase
MEFIMNRHEQWRKWYENEKKQPYFQAIYQQALEMDSHTLLSPDPAYWLRAFEFDDFTKIHTVIVGNRPHKHAYAADGYAFSSIDETDREMGLLYRKLYKELGVSYNQDDNSKERWAKQGILPMTIELTTISGANLDMQRLWYPFTKRILRYFIDDIQLRAFLFLDRFTPNMPELFVDKPNKEHLYLNRELWSTDFQNKPVFTPINDFIESNYSCKIDWQ